MPRLGLLEIESRLGFLVSMTEVGFVVSKSRVGLWLKMEELLLWAESIVGLICVFRVKSRLCGTEDVVAIADKLFRGVVASAGLPTL